MVDYSSSPKENGVLGPYFFLLTAETDRLALGG